MAWNGLKENGVVSFDSKKKANIFCRSTSNLADRLLQKLPRPKKQFGIKTREEYYKQIWNPYENLVLLNVEVNSVEMILKNLDIVNFSGIEQISGKFLKEIWLQ